ncbi:hypothetical protein CNYM01_14270, partial [Colletotrichum nymphaeae SA-01]
MWFSITTLALLGLSGGVIGDHGSLGMTESWSDPRVPGVYRAGYMQGLHERQFHPEKKDLCYKAVNDETTKSSASAMDIPLASRKHGIRKTEIQKSLDKRPTNRKKYSPEPTFCQGPLDIIGPKNAPQAPGVYRAGFMHGLHEQQFHIRKKQLWYEAVNDEMAKSSTAKRRRDTEAQPTRPSLTGSQLDATNDAPSSIEGPATSTASAPTGSATGSVLTALAEEARQYEARKDVFLTIAQSVDSVVASFDGSRKQIAKEASGYVIQALKRLINHETTPAAARSWAAVAAPMAGNTTATTRSGQSSARPKAPLPAPDQPQAQPEEDLRIFARVPEEGLA